MKKEKTTPLSHESKIVPPAQLAERLADARKKGQKIVLCLGSFDLIHPGHIFHFEAAKREGDILVVAITRDEHVNKGPGRPVFNHHIRAQSVAALNAVDWVVINEGATGVETIQHLRPDIYAKGSEYTKFVEAPGAFKAEAEAVEEMGGRVHFTMEPTFSSSELLNRHFMVFPDQAKEYLEKFRRKYSAQDIISRMEKLKKMKVLVIGETIVDEYHYCAPMGKSAKESIVASKYLREEAFAGGILACANHVAGFVKAVEMVSVLGAQDSREEFVRRHLKPEVEPFFVERSDAPTIVKRRYVWDPFLVKLFEVLFMNEKPLPEDAEKKLVAHLKKEVPKYDLVIVADYGHGLFTPAVIDVLAKKAKFLAVNTQTNSANTGFNMITKYPRADYVCIDDPEMRLAYRDRFGDLKVLIKKTATALKSSYVTVTRGHLGSLVYSKGNGFVETPIFSKEIVDRVGAGDAFLAVTAPAVAAGFPAELVGFIGNAVGAMAVKIVGNRSAIEPAPLYKFITTLLK